jgi:type IX secretion system PorP/SprF family membrane protein
MEMIMMFRMKKLCVLSLLLALLLWPELRAQTFPLSSHFLWNPQAEQPAMAGSADGIRLLAGFRYQWTGIEGAPQTAYAGADMKLPLKNSSAGIWMNYDKTGLMSFTQVRLSYAYTQPLNSKSALSAGIHAGLLSIGLDGSRITTPGGSGGNDDDLLPRERSNGIRPEIGLGLNYQHELFYAGLFVQNLAGATSQINGLNGSFRADYGRHMGIQAGAVIPVGQNFSIDPALMLRTDLNNLQLDLATTLTYRKRFSAGLGFRGYNNNSVESLMALARIGITKDLALGYSYDSNLSGLNTVTNGSHEVSIGYLIPRDSPVRKGKIINHPRFL